ncbi:MAG: hypothetical protein LBJ02_03590 [Bifidobacteriaceae bacterium]|nr:hypothetical protein [Bifidobacteriaceae bacterium]
MTGYPGSSSPAPVPLRAGGQGLPAPGAASAAWAAEAERVTAAPWFGQREETSPSPGPERPGISVWPVERMGPPPESAVGGPGAHTPGGLGSDRQSPTVGRRTEPSRAGQAAAARRTAGPGVAAGAGVMTPPGSGGGPADAWHEDWAGGPGQMPMADGPAGRPDGFGPGAGGQTRRPSSVTVHPPAAAQAKVDVDGTLTEMAPVQVPIALPSFAPGSRGGRNGAGGQAADEAAPAADSRLAVRPEAERYSSVDPRPRRRAEVDQYEADQYGVDPRLRAPSEVERYSSVDPRPRGRAEVDRYEDNRYEADQYGVDPRLRAPSEAERYSAADQPPFAVMVPPPAPVILPPSGPAAGTRYPAGDPSQSPASRSSGEPLTFLELTSGRDGYDRNGGPLSGQDDIYRIIPQAPAAPVAFADFAPVAGADTARERPSAFAEELASPEAPSAYPRGAAAPSAYPSAYSSAFSPADSAARSPVGASDPSVPDGGSWPDPRDELAGQSFSQAFSAPSESPATFGSAVAGGPAGEMPSGLPAMAPPADPAVAPAPEVGGPSGLPAQWSSSSVPSFDDQPAADPESYWDGGSAMPAPGAGGVMAPSGVIGEPGLGGPAMGGGLDLASAFSPADGGFTPSSGEFTPFAGEGGLPEDGSLGGFGLGSPGLSTASEAAAAPSGVPGDQDMAWEAPPQITADGRGPWLDGPDAPWGSAPSHAGRRALKALVWALAIGAAVAIVQLFL